VVCTIRVNKLEMELTVVASLVITGFTQSVLASIDEVFHLSIFALSVLRLRIEVDVYESQLEPTLS
jgi:hypothetical protein